LALKQAKTSGLAGTGLKGLSGVRQLDQSGKPKRRKRELSEAEIFEIRQLIASGVKSAKDYPEIMGIAESDEEEAGGAEEFGGREAVEQDFEVCYTLRDDITCAC
jgi:hypothetical protein